MGRFLRNIVQRNRIFHFRRAVPHELRTRFKRSELTCSLRTSELRVAELRSRQLYVASESLFEESRHNPMLSDDQLAAIVQDFYGHVLGEENKLRLRLGRIPEEVRASRAEHFGQIAAQARADLGANEFGSVSFITQAMMRKHKLEGQLDETQTRQLAQSLMRGGIDLADAVQARYAGDFNFEPRDKLLARKVEAIFNPAPAPAPKETAAADKQPLFSVVAAAFVAKQKQLHRWENQTASQNEKSYELFKAICGDRPLNSYQRKDAARFKDQLERLPAEYGKSAIYAGKSPEEILEIDAANGGEADRLSIRTVKRHISALSSLWDESIPQGVAADKIFAGFKFPAQQRAQDQRPMWRRSDLAKLFNTPIWSGCKSEGRRSTAGSLVIRDEKFWLPLIAVFSGARQEEICQLHVEDIRQEGGIWLFDINMKPPRKLKNKSAVRFVPIHSELIRLGLLGYVERQRDAGQVRIFPNLHPGGADGRLGHGFTKWFTRYRRDVDVYEQGRDFHSFRHSATTFLHQGGVEDSTLDRLTGHTTPGQTSRYNKESYLAQLKAAIDKIDIEVDFKTLYER